ncbi:bb3-type cytochrome oxidase subunit IV, partial [Sinorhizobium sp. 6-117]|nr:bb3-type cytochrome oxidase subunit IV [Sinorhizobium sp. 6-117]
MGNDRVALAAAEDIAEIAAADWASDQRAFKNVSWGKAMMWIFLLS